MHVYTGRRKITGYLHAADAAGRQAFGKTSVIALELYEYLN
jgi:hypothetical protein